MSLASNLSRIQSELNQKARLLAVSKYQSDEDVIELYHLGQRDFGENRPQDLLARSQRLKKVCPDLKWHFIGGLQSNKINMLMKVDNLVAIHSIDRMNLLTKLIKSTPSQSIDLFLQVKTSPEEEKAGFKDLSEIKDAVGLIEEAKGYRFAGFMTMGPVRTEAFEADARSSFQKLLDLKELYPNALLSMGMSRDYQWALEYQTDWVRLGSELFKK